MPLGANLSGGVSCRLPQQYSGESRRSLVQFMETFLQDLRLGARAIFAKPSFALVASVTLALGIGANVAMLSFAEALLRHPLPYEDPPSLMVLWRETEKFPRSPLSFPVFFDWKERNRVFSQLAMYLESDLNLIGSHGEPERLSGLLVSANFPETLGIQPYQGRFFTPEDNRPDSPRTALLSYELWQRRFGGEPEVLGDVIRLNGDVFTVIGILPPGLSDERIGDVSLGEVWLPVGVFFDQLPMEDRADFSVRPIGRLRPGVGLQEARADMDRIARELAEEHPSIEANVRGVGVIPIFEDLVGDLKPTIYVLLVTVGLVLVMACINLVNLLLSHTGARQRNAAIRSALGASRRRLVRQTLTESLVLSFLSTLPALALAGLAIHLLPSILPGIPYADRAALTPSVLGATVVLCPAVALAIGLVPALQSIRPGALHLAGGPALPVHKRSRQTMIVAELALATALLVGAALVVSSLGNLLRVDLGFSPDSVLTQLVILPESEYGDVARWTELFDETLERLAALPGVENVAVTDNLPLVHPNGGFTSPVADPDQQPIPKVSDMANTIFQTVSPDYFRAMGIPLREGRIFTPQDDDRQGSPKVAVINETLARSFWGEGSVVGKRIGFELVGDPEDFEIKLREVVGVVGDVHNKSISSPPKNAIYVPYTQIPRWWTRDEGSLSPMASQMSVVVKTSVDPKSVAGPVRTEISKIAPQLPVFSVRTLQEIVNEQLKHPRMVSTLLSCFAGLALALAVVGVYGVLSYIVVAQTHDIGLRMALGATPRRILAGVLGQGLVMIVLGVGIGLVLAWNLTHLMSSLLHGIEARDPGIFAAVAVIMAAVAFLANLFPALRAMRLNPSQVLRWE